MAQQPPQPPLPQGILEPEDRIDIAKLASIYLQNEAETLDFTSEGILSTLAALYELTKRRGGMKKAHAKKIERIVMAAGTFQHQGGKQEKQPAEKRHKPAIKGWAAKSEGIAVTSSNYMLRRIDGKVSKEMPAKERKEYGTAKAKMEQIEQRLEGWMAELKASLQGAPKKEALRISKTIAAIEAVQATLEREKQSFHDWLFSLGARGKYDSETVMNYYCRMAADQGIFATKKNILFVASGKGQASPEIKPDLGLLPSHVTSAEKKALQELEKARGIKFEKVNDINSKEFIEGYGMLRAHFPPDELDQSKDIIFMIQGDPSYYLLVAKDKSGKIIGACDGNFVADKEKTAMYWAHVAVPGEERREGVATLLYSATLGLGNAMAHAAEKELGTSYATGIKGNKLMYFVLETEPANLMDEDSVKTTMGRLIFHGSLGLSVALGHLYAQADLDYTKPDFVQREWNTVPLLLPFRKLDGSPIAEKDIKAMSDVMRDAFLNSGTLNADGIKYDFEFSIKNLHGDGLRVLSLPRNAKELFDFIDAVGTMETRCRSLYSDHLWSNEYLAALAEAGGGLTIKEAKQLYLAYSARTRDTTPPSA